MRIDNKIVTLNNGLEIPSVGLGVYKTESGEELLNAIKYAYNAGYRHIDTASIYGNEQGVGDAIKQLEIPRDKMFITSKVWNSDQGYEQTKHAFSQSLQKLQTDYLDLYLIHWPVKAKFLDTWKALEELYKAGKVKAIGVSNFMIEHLQELRNNSNIVPAVNQIEFHPRLVQQPLLNFCHKNGIQPIAWRPIMKGQVNEIPELKSIAAKYGKSAVQIVLRWDLQKGVLTIPKSVNKSRINENMDIFDFELTNNEVSIIDALDRNERTSNDPYNVNF